MLKEAGLVSCKRKDDMIDRLIATGNVPAEILDRVHEPVERFDQA